MILIDAQCCKCCTKCKASICHQRALQLRHPYRTRPQLLILAWYWTLELEEVAGGGRSGLHWFSPATWWPRDPVTPRPGDPATCPQRSRGKWMDVCILSSSFKIVTLIEVRVMNCRTSIEQANVPDLKKLLPHFNEAWASFPVTCFHIINQLLSSWSVWSIAVFIMHGVTQLSCT